MTLTATWENYKSLPNADNVTRTTLSNGIVVLLRRNPHSSSIALAGYVPAGSAHDPVEKLGLADFVARALKYGTQQYDFNQIYSLLESCGANLGFSGSTHNTNFSGRALSEDLPMMLGLLRQALEQPTFPEQEVDMLRDQLLTGLQIRAQDTRAIAAINFDRMMYGDTHPYGRPSDGFIETVQAITTEDLRAFHQAHYGPHGMVVAVTGNIDPSATIATLETALGDWHNSDQAEELEISVPEPLVEPQRMDAEIADKFQTDLVMGTPGPNRNSPDYLTAILGNNILGQFGLMGRIGDVVRDQAGLAYHASTTLNATSISGVWEVVAGVNPGNLNRAIDLIKSELERFRTTKVEAEELADSRANLIGRLPISLESNAGVAYLLLRIERFNLGLNYLQDYIKTLSAATAEDIQDVAARYINFDQLVISSAGPARESETAE